MKLEKNRGLHHVVNSADSASSIFSKFEGIHPTSKSRGLLPLKFNFMKIKNNIFRHRQIERRNNLLFMRMKQRSLLIVRRVENEKC